MSNQLRPTEPGTQGASRILRRQVKKAIEELQADDQSLSDEAVHGARKRLKKARAALRLLRDSLGSRLYRRENAALRDAARPLTAVRDAKVLTATVDKLADSANGHLDAGVSGKLKQSLQDTQREVRRRVLEDKDSIAAARQSLEHTFQRIKESPIGRHGWSVLGAGLKRVYRGARKAFAKARDNPSTANLHEWRKQTKYLWHQLQMLEPIWPGVLEPLTDQLHRLTDQLGDDHDLALLREKLQQEPSLLPERTAADVFVKLIDRRRTELEKQALTLGSRFFADPPKQFTNRLHCQWRIWSSQSQN
jgi:CHAD domain-containing protein